MEPAPIDVDETLDDVAETSESEPLQGQPSSHPTPTRSHYALTRQEITRGIANRFVHSRTYIFLYLGMAALSITTVVLSMVDGCPGLAFYVLEVIINGAMIIEVGIRLVAFGKQFWRSPFNIVDLILTAFCAITLLVLAFSRCGAASKEEELLDTLLLVARNVLQFSRLAAVMRQSGQSIFSRPKPIDLSAARRAGFSLDFDIADEEEQWPRSAARNPVVFDAPEDEEPRGEVRAAPQRARPAPYVDERDTEDVWASLG